MLKKTSDTALLGRIDKRGNLYFPTLTGDFNSIYNGIGYYLQAAANKKKG